MTDEHKLNKEVEVRLYKTGDASGILGMFTKYFPYKRDEEFWVWINRIIGEDSIVAVATICNKIVGHYAIVPRKIFVDNIEYNSGLGIHAVVDPEYREYVSIFEISNLAYKEANKRGLSFVYGFPNANYRFIQEKLEKWKRVSIFNAYELDLNKDSCLLPQENIFIEKIEASDFKKIYDIQVMIEKSVKMPVTPSNGGKNWLLRYILHPQHLYETFEIHRNSEVVGFVVTKNYTKENFRYRHIIDYVFSDTVNIESILTKLVTEAQKEQIDYYSVWKGDTSFEKAILKFGFLPTGFDTFLGVKVIDKSLSQAVIDKLTDFSNWRLVMGDTDSF